RVHALDNRCPHKGVPLSSAWQEGDSLRCPFHGWRFVASGECVEVPAIGKVAHLSPASACVKTFPAEERDGWVWVYMGNDRCPKPSVPPPSLPAPADGSPMVSVRRSAEAKVRWDFAVDSLMDPAHVPFVHHNYFRRREAARKKDKVFTRLPLGFRTISQNVLLPDTFIFRALSLRLGSATTTVDFVLPGIHSERWEIGARFASSAHASRPSCWWLLPSRMNEAGLISASDGTSCGESRSEGWSAGPSRRFSARTGTFWNCRNRGSAGRAVCC
ncbi:MAG: aromatic ring-hydroxylating dioxygenase subunit alpha, partial [Nitrospira sp.]|nr:aromatic ring-hydroxylating dioxygenase subunit alpha [Nitrospira sp.]